MIAAFPAAKAHVPDLRMIVVAGPRIDPATLPDVDGLEVRPYVHDLYRHLAACDLAVVQGGLTTSMELTAAQRPFLYFPLRHHFEQYVPRRPPARPLRGGPADGLRQRPRPSRSPAPIAEEIGREVDYAAGRGRRRPQGRRADRRAPQLTRLDTAAPAMEAGP